MVGVGGFEPPTSWSRSRLYKRRRPLASFLTMTISFYLIYYNSQYYYSAYKSDGQKILNINIFIPDLKCYKAYNFLGYLKRVLCIREGYINLLVFSGMCKTISEILRSLELLPEG